MPVTEILLLRHGHRLAWTLDPSTGKYSSNVPYPTRLPADPPLASHGVSQAQETGRYLGKLLFHLAREDRLRIYSSLFYRCLETLRPTIEILRKELQINSSTGERLHGLGVRGEQGIGEWFGHAWFEQPTPAEPVRLQKDFFPWLDSDYKSRIIPGPHGERIEVLHDRIARALEQIITDVDQELIEAGRQEDEVTILICGHAAQIIASGRALTGVIPEDYDEDDFQCFTCGISKFVRRTLNSSANNDQASNSKNGSRVMSQWECVLNSDCSHLSQGAERGWHFHGDESFDSYGATLGINPKTSDGGLDSDTKKVEDSNESTPKL